MESDSDYDVSPEIYGDCSPSEPEYYSMMERRIDDRADAKAIIGIGRI